MKTIKVLISAILIFFINIELVYSQDSSTIFIYPSMAKIEININCQVSYQSKLYNYKYTVISDESSKQSIDGIMIDRQAEVELMSAPYLWRTAKPRALNTFAWWTADSNYYVHPSESKTDFELKSKYLPSILKYYATGYVPLPVFPLGQEPAKVVNNGIENSKQGLTIGPADPPDPFIPSAFIDTLISHKHHAHGLGWIGNKGTIKSLDKKLENAQKQIDKGKNKTACNILNAFLNELEALYKNHHTTKKGGQDHGEGPPFITDEAYALLKYNTEYLIEQLEK